MRARSFERGSAVVETTLVLGVVLTAVMGAVQLGLTGFGQLEADGSGFIGAHSAALVGGAQTAQQSAATSVVSTVFPHVNGVALTANSSGSTSTADVALPILGLSAFMSMQGITARSHVIERTASPAAAQPVGNVAFSIPSASLTNVPGVSRYPVWLAQTVVSNAQGGPNGRFAEWDCHAKVYGNLKFPSSRPTYAAFDPTQPGTTEYSIYQWDVTKTC